MKAFLPPALMSGLIHFVGDKIAPHGPGEGRLCIVNYHRIVESLDPLLESEPDVRIFRWQMELLAECFNVMPLYDAIAALRTQRMPSRAVCITFDDGYRSTHDLALPILKELNLPATVFVTTGHMGQGNMWNDNIIEAIRCLPDGSLDLRELALGIYPLRTMHDRKHAINTLTEASKYLLPEARLALDKKLEKLIGDNPVQQLMLTRDMVANLSHQGIEIGGHTITHPILTSLDDEVARFEVVQNKRLLEEITGKPVRLFAYPNGKQGIDFDERHMQMVKNAGYDAAFTTEMGAATKLHDRYAIPRGRPWDLSRFMFSVRLLYWLMGRTPQKL